MSDGNLQTRTFCDDFTQFAGLTVSVLESDTQQGSFAFHQTEHLHHGVGSEGLSHQSVTGDGHTLEALSQQQVFGLLVEVVLKIVGHAEDEETVRILA